MEPITAAALTFLLCSQIQPAGALPVGHHPANYQHEALGNGKQGSYVKASVAAKTQNENPPCQLLPVTDEPLRGMDTTPPPPISINKPGQDTYHKPRPLPPSVLYRPIVPYYVLPPSPVSGGSHVYRQGAGHAGFMRGGGPLLPHSPFGASGLLPAPRWFLGLQRDKHLPQSSGSPAGSQRGPVPAQRFDSTSSETSSEEGSDGD